MLDLVVHVRFMTMAAARRQTVLPALLRQINDRTIFELLLRRRSASRSQMQTALGTTAPTIHKAVARLVSAGLLEPVGLGGAGRPGRPGMVYQLASTSSRVLGVAVDVRHVTIVSAGLDGEIDPADVTRFPTPRQYKTLVDRIADELRRRIDCPGRTLGVGITMPGEIDFAQQRVAWSPNLHLTDGTSLSQDLSSRLDVHARMYHETTATCLAEWSRGAARGQRDFVLIGVYEGFGTAIVSEGRLVQGRDGLGSELGHITVAPDGPQCGCGNYGCIETLATDQAFARRVSHRHGRKMTIEQIVTDAGADRIDVRAELDETLRYLAIGIAAAINLFNPERVLVCSRMFDVDAGAMNRLTQMTAERTLKPLRERHCLVRAIGDTSQGAIAAAIHHLTDSLGPSL